MRGGDMGGVIHLNQITINQDSSATRARDGDAVLRAAPHHDILKFSAERSRAWTWLRGARSADRGRVGDARGEDVVQFVPLTQFCSESQRRQGPSSVEVCRDADLSPAFSIGCTGGLRFSRELHGIAAEQEVCR